MRDNQKLIARFPNVWLINDGQESHIELHHCDQDDQPSRFVIKRIENRANVDVLDEHHEIEVPLKDVPIMFLSSSQNLQGSVFISLTLTGKYSFLDLVILETVYAMNK